LREEQKDRDEEERLNNPDLSLELEKLRIELGGPFFTEQENNIYKE